jgi:Protein of unknown function (DUF3443)
MRKTRSLRTLLGYLPYWLTILFASLGLISCGGGGGGGGGGNAAPAVAECLQFLSGYTWGSVRSADITLGGKTILNRMIQVIADPAFPTAPHACSGTGPAWKTVKSLGANGIIGISTFAQDCGQGCADQATNGYYYSCAGRNCSPLAVPVANQVWNPVALFAGDNNGTIIYLPGVSSTGATQVDGTLTFGIGTQPNNAVGSATVITVDSTYGEFSSSVNGTAYPGIYGDPGSFIDSGSNGLFYGSGIFDPCHTFQGFYCPSPSPRAQNGVLDPGGVNLPINFTVSNPELLASTITADAELAGPGFGGVDWGLPLFFGRTIYTAIEGKPVTGATNGPWVGVGSVTPGSGTNQIPVVVDAGPNPAIVSVINALYASVILCAPGSTTNCQTIDHLLVDTGSSGVRILAPVLQPGLLAALPQSTP